MLGEARRDGVTTPLQVRHSVAPLEVRYAVPIVVRYYVAQGPYKVETADDEFLA